MFLASTQLPKLCGFHGLHGDFWENSAHFLKHLQETNSASLSIGLVALAVLVLGKQFFQNKPVALFVHKPLFLNAPDDPELVATSFRYVPQPARRFSQWC